MASAANPAAKARKPAPQANQNFPAPPALQGSEDRLLLETQELDLFHKKTKSKLLVCPDCHHELVKLMCLGKMVPVCCHCRGVWLNRNLVGEFAQEIDWFQQLGPAVELYAHSKRQE